MDFHRSRPRLVDDLADEQYNSTGMATPASIRTVPQWESELGRQIRDLRLRAERTQVDLAAEANVSVSALHSLEHGRGSSLATLVAVVRAIGRADWLETLAPPATVSPMAVLRARREAEDDERQRASGRGDRTR